MTQTTVRKPWPSILRPQDRVTSFVSVHRPVSHELVSTRWEWRASSTGLGGSAQRALRSVRGALTHRSSPPGKEPREASLPASQRSRSPSPALRTSTQSAEKAHPSAGRRAPLRSQRSRSHRTQCAHGNLGARGAPAPSAVGGSPALCLLWLRAACEEGPCSRVPGGRVLGQPGTLLTALKHPGG